MIAGLVPIVLGLGDAFPGREKTGLNKSSLALPAQKGEYKKALIAVLVILVVGVGTFYGVSFISSIQPTVSTSSGTTNSSVSTATYSSGSSGQTGISNSVTTESSESSVPADEFTIVGSPTVVTSGNTANVTVTFSNTGPVATTANIYVNVYYPNGTIEASGPLLYPEGPTVAPGDNFSATLNTGELSPPGTYSATFFVVEGASGTSQQQISSETTTTFKISA